MQCSAQYCTAPVNNACKVDIFPEEGFIHKSSILDLMPHGPNKGVDS
jgi:hypothetical protein